MTDFTARIHSEKLLDGFTALDGTIRFYGFVKALLLKEGAKDVLDFGAGRGSGLLEDTSVYRRYMRDLRVFGAKVVACDVDTAVLGHSCSSSQVVIAPDERLPFKNESFDLVVSDMTFEHLEKPDFVAAELIRILRPGGYICARTPNRLGYLRLFTMMVPNALHKRVLMSVQPDRKSQDVFPTLYRLNSPKHIRSHFRNCSLSYYYDSAEPAYYFGNAIIYRTLLLLHKLAPSSFSNTICVFIRKSSSGPDR